MEQMESQMRVQAKQAELGMMPGMPADPSQAANAPMIPEPAPGAFDQPEEEEGAEGAAPAQSGEEGAAPQGKKNNREIEAIASQMSNMNEAERAQMINKMDSQTAQRVMMYLTQWEQNESQEIDMTPMPEKLPPRRPGGV